jgi:enoyl-[acyl-carrier protein] reductase I
VHFVDCGYNTTSMPSLDDLKTLEADAQAAGRPPSAAAE